MLLHENMKTNPAWLVLDQQEDKERIYNFLVRNSEIFRLLPEYEGVNIKQLPKLVHAETFPFHPVTLEEKPVTLLFNYRRTDFFGNASIAEVSL